MTTPRDTSSMFERLKDKVKPKPPPAPVWKGPAEDGVTYSLLSKFLACRERFRARVVLGLAPAERFNHRTGYGSLWHVCEEAYHATSILPWERVLQDYAKSLCRQFPLQQEEIDKWYNVAKIQFPIYLKFWEEHPDVKERYVLAPEAVFSVPYTLPSGRTVRLRGRWDSIDQIGKGKNAALYVQENKTKGDLDEAKMLRELSSGFDLQTMLYCVAFQTALHRGDPPPMPALPFGGIRYNVIRRPLSGGKGSITQHKPSKSNPQGESKAAFFQRLAGIIAEDPAYYFMRWKIEISPNDLTRFRDECLDPILESLCDWWEWVGGSTERGVNVWDNDTTFQGKPWSDEKAHASAIHWRYPFGVYNPLDEGRSSEYDEYLRTGSTIGLTKDRPLFEELI